MTTRKYTCDKLVIFYDGNCPLCSLEMQKLKQHDANNQIELVNLHQANFNTLYPDINFNKAMTILHGVYQKKLLLGLNVTHRAWTIVGKGAFVAPLQLPIVKQLAHCFYLLVAKYRHPLSQFIYRRLGIGTNTCELGVCYEKSAKETNNIDHRRQ
ncbi:thiol-disulfide oxidoreductase DCC family protein [Thalassotalea sp. PLHSN55]|uniref:thiol-disulfide oxidoreductase DCC family protein n=1 Tax=Thalassotalea sp. PLHSN55 TaxID=3435888 RepID=UPI003F8617CA